MNYKVYILLVFSQLIYLTYCSGININKSEQIKNSNSTKEYFFLGASYPLTSESFLLILDYNNVPIFIKEMEFTGHDFKVQANGYLTYHENGKRRIIMMDSSYKNIDTLQVTSGYYTDFHDVQVLDNGHQILLGNDYSIVDMSAFIIGGNKFATVVDLIIQEFDENKNLIFEGNSKDHFNILDTYVSLISQNIDYVHGNSIEIDIDGNFILSSRSLSEITKIDRTTGDIIWRFGGKNNEFTFINDETGFSFQHSAKRLDNGNIYLFDNGNLHELDYSRGLMYELDETNKTAELISQYKHPDNLYVDYMGSAQQLPNGNMLIGWGNNKEGVVLTEFDSKGEVVYNLKPETAYQSYRVFRFPWKTNKFYSNIDSLNFDTIEYGNDSLIQIRIQNNSTVILELSSFTNFNSVFKIVEEFPVSINANDFIDLNVQFKPDKLGGSYNDVLTINSDSYNNDLFERIAIQVELYGYSPDISPPEFTIFPNDGSSDISIDTKIEMIFNEPIRFTNNSEINNDNIQDFIELRKKSINGEIISITALISKEKDEIIITPDINLNYSEDYYVVIDNQIEDFNDNAITDSFISFRTSDATGVIVNPLNEIILFPNPTKDLIKISFHKKPQIIKISNMNGELVYIDTKVQELNNYKVDFSDKNNGIYLVFIVFDDGSFNISKFVKN